MKKICFQSDRLKIRPHLDRDIDLLNRAIVDSYTALNQWMDWAKKPQTIEQTKNFIEYVNECWDKKFPSELPFLIFDPKEKFLIGSIALNRINWNISSFEIGYWINEPYSKQGYITEAVSVLTDFAFSQLHAKRIKICCDSENIKSANIPRKLKFKLEAHLKNHRTQPVTGKVSDTYIFSRFDLTDMQKVNYEIHSE